MIPRGPYTTPRWPDPLLLVWGAGWLLLGAVMWAILRILAAQLPHTLPDCVVVSNTAMDECSVQFENAWYDEGAAQYGREQHLKDKTHCTNVRNAVFHQCEQIVKENK